MAQRLAEWILIQKKKDLAQISKDPAAIENWKSFEVNLKKEQDLVNQAVESKILEFLIGNFSQIFLLLFSNFV